jgi:hypothetical protein
MHWGCKLSKVDCPTPHMLSSTRSQINSLLAFVQIKIIRIIDDEVYVSIYHLEAIGMEKYIGSI